MFRSKKLLRHPGLSTGLVIVLAYLFMCLCGPYLVPFSPLEQDLFHRLEPPSLTHLLGTDELGRDTLSRLVYGSRTSLEIGLVATGFSLLVGTILGSIAGFYGGISDALIMRLIDVLLAFPGIFLALIIMAVLGKGMSSVMIAVGISGSPAFARTVRGCTLSARENVYVEAARAVGASSPRIIIKHILPNIVSPLIVLSTLRIGAAILVGAGLSFLGLGVQPPTPEWGAMLNEGRQYLRIAPYLTMVPGLALFIVIMGFNLLGDGLRDILDPTMKT